MTQQLDSSNLGADIARWIQANLELVLATQFGALTFAVRDGRLYKVEIQQSFTCGHEFVVKKP